MKSFSSQKTLDNFLIIRTLGYGNTGKVKLGRHKVNGQPFALKIFDAELFESEEERDETFRALKKEKEFLQNINHPNIIKFFDFVEKGTYSRPNKPSKFVAYMITEYAHKGEIFEIVSRSIAFSENAALHFFNQLLNAMEYLNANGLAHRDLRPENLLLDKDLNLKLIDFGFATRIVNSKSMTTLGSEGYMAPEILSEEPYDAQKSDIFSAGLILFLFVTGQPMFQKADKNDVFYKMFLADRAKFWTVR